MYRTRLSIAAAILAVCTASCKKAEGPVYNESTGFAFAANVLNAEVTKEDEGKLLVPVYRGTCDYNSASIAFEFDAAPEGSSKPDWVSADPSDIFSLISKKVSFADDSYTSYAQIRFGDVDKLGISKKYKMRLSIGSELSPSMRDTVVVTVSRKLTFKKYGDCTYFDECIFDNSYNAVIYKAEEAEIYRISDPYKEGLIAEEYAAEGLMGETPDYVKFSVEPDGHIVFTEFPTGMLVPTGGGKNCMAWIYYPSAYKWGKDFSEYDEKNQKLSDKHFQLYGVYCLPDFQYGFLNDGIYRIDINVK